MAKLVGRISVGSIMIASLLATASGLGASDSLRLQVSPRVGRAPSNVRLTAFVEPHEKNRALRIEADSGDYYRASEFDLQGRDAARVHAIEWESLPEGDYTIRATITGPGNVSLAKAQSRMMILGFVPIEMD